MTIDDVRLAGAAPWLVGGDHWWPVETPVGRLTVAGNDTVVHHLRLPGAGPAMPDAGDEPRLPGDRRGRPAAVAQAVEQVVAYFDGRLRRFHVPLEPLGTPWQRTVWRALGAIGFGDTTSYGEIAALVGNPRAARAVGLANRGNPIALIVPCHRVIGANGHLTGYAGGLPLKARLLEHERRVLAAGSR